MTPNSESVGQTLNYTSQEFTGVSILVVVTALSFFAVVGLLFAIALSAFNTRRSTDRFLFVRTHAAAYFISLMVCWLIQCIASLLNVHWLKGNGITSGNFCTAQGVLKHIADVGVAVWTFVMAANTFSHLFLERNPGRCVMWLLLLSGWFLIGVTIGSGPAFIHTRGPFYEPNGVWCWISPNYKVQIITLGYMIILLSACLSGVLYLMTFLRLRGNLVRSDWKLKLRRIEDSADKYFSNDRTKQIAKQMLLYPLAYAILIIPVAIARFITWSGKAVPFELTIFSASVYMLSGFVNVILFTTTRRILPLGSMRIGSRYLVPGSRPSTKDGSDDLSGQWSEDSAERGASKMVTFSTGPRTVHTLPGRKELRRPQELVLSNDRDSFASTTATAKGFTSPLP